MGGDQLQSTWLRNKMWTRSPASHNNYASAYGCHSCGNSNCNNICSTECAGGRAWQRARGGDIAGDAGGSICRGVRTGCAAAATAAARWLLDSHELGVHDCNRPYQLRLLVLLEVHHNLRLNHRRVLLREVLLDLAWIFTSVTGARQVDGKRNFHLSGVDQLNMG